MAKDVLITPGLGLIQFKDADGNVDATIQLDDANVLNISGTVSLGDLAADVYIGDGVNEVDIVFEQNGIIYALAGKTLTLGQANSSISLAANITSGANITGNVNVGNLVTNGRVISTGNVSGGNITTIGLITATGNITGGNVNSVGGTFTGNVNFGNVFVGGYYWANGAVFAGGGGGGSPGGANTQVQFNDNGVFNGSAGLTFNKTTNALSTTGTFSATGNITGANLNVTNDIFDTGPLRIITGASGAISLAPNASNVVVVSTTGAAVTGTMSATGNASGGNVTTTGIFSGAGGLQAWSTTTPGLGLGGLHLGSASGTTNSGPAITFGARDASSGTNAQAGIYINSDGSYGTRMYFATTDSYVTGSRVSSYIDHSGIFYVNVRNSATAIANGGTNGVGNIGASGASFNTVFARATSAQYADLAEMYQGDSSYAPGTVVEFGGEHEVTITTTESSTRIAGVVSTNPSYLMNCELNGVNAVAVALTGRVPCQVLGPVRKGDRLVSSSIPGVAHAIDESIYRPGCIIGKSLEDWTEATITSIEVVVGRL